MEDNKFYFYSVIVLLVLSILTFAVVLNSKYDFIYTGRAGTDTGYANLTVESSASINFTTDTINWGSGLVDVGETNATLDTAAGTVLRGNWTAVSQGLVIENIGNVNVSLDLAAAKTAAEFLGGSDPAYQWNFTEAEAGSCLSTVTDVVYGYYNDTNASTTVCNNFPFVTGNDSIRVDILIRVPYDSLTGALSDTLTATATGL